MADRSFCSRLKLIWRKASHSLFGLAAMGLALGIGIGLGLWLGDVAGPSAPPSTTVATPVFPQSAAPQSVPPAARAALPQLSVAPWVPDPRRASPPALDLPPEPGAAPPAMLPDAPTGAPTTALPEEIVLPAWRRNAVTPPATNGRPLVAIVIDDMGVDLRHSTEASALPGPLTLAYLPYARDLAGQTAAARRAGHELMVHVSMQPQAKLSPEGERSMGGDPGPNALTVGLPPEEIRRRLAWALGQFDGYVGINNHMGSRFTADRAGMAVVIEELKTRGLLFLDSRTTPASVGESLAQLAGVPHATRHVFLDNLQTSSELQARLAETERIAKARGAAIAIGHPHGVTIEALRLWLPGLQERGVALVPLSAIVARNSAAKDAVGLANGR